MRKIVDGKAFTAGLWRENPILFLMLGLCPLLAISGSVRDSIGMSAALTFVLAGSNVMVSAIRKVVPDQVRIPVFIIIIATFVTVTDYTLAATMPDLHRNLGVFLPLIVVNCIVLGRAEAYACKNTVLNALLDGLGMGVGFFLIILLMSIIREGLGNGTIAGIPIFGPRFTPFLILILPPGAFLVLGFLIALKNSLSRRTHAE